MLDRLLTLSSTFDEVATLKLLIVTLLIESRTPLGRLLRKSDIGQVPGCSRQCQYGCLL